MKNLRTLLDVAGAGIEVCVPTGEAHNLILDCLPPGMKGDFLRLYSERNGFYAFESALWIYPLTSRKDHSLAKINNLESMGLYRSVIQSGLIFGSDAIGNQFFVDKNGFWLVDMETAEKEHISDTLDGWAREILVDINYRTAYPLSHEWQKINGALRNGDRLGPKIPFILGGDYIVDNLAAIDAVELIGFRSHLFAQIRDMVPGSKIEWKITK